MANDKLEALKCMATDQTLRELENIEGSLMIFVGNKAETVTAVGLISGDVIKDAKTIKIVLSKDTPDANFHGLSYQCIENFK